MKNLELSEMEILTAGDTGGWVTGFMCGATIALSTAVIVGTAGAGVVAGAYATAAACGGGIGFGLATGEWW